MGCLPSMSVNRSNSRRPTREEAYSPDPEDQQRKEGMRPQSASKGVFSFTARRTTSVAPTSSTSPQSEGRVQRWTLDDELTGSDERRTSAVEQSGGANRRSRNMSIFGQTSSITGSNTTSLERKLEASMAALGQQLQVELKRHAAESQQRLTETEDRLKMRVTQMERLLLETTQQQHMQVPQMQQQPQQQAAGSPAGSPAEMHSSGALCGAPSSADLPSGGGNVMPPRSLNGANGLDGGSPFKIRSALGPSVGPMRPGGDGTHSGLGEAERAQMHSLVESDGEIQALLRDMRRQGAKLKPLKTNDVLAPRPGTSSGGGAAIGAVDYGANVADEGRTSGRTSRMLRLLCGAVIHPEAKFRSVWNALMALLIIYCGTPLRPRCPRASRHARPRALAHSIAPALHLPATDMLRCPRARLAAGVTIPLEIAFEDDMILAWCGAESSVRVRAECASFQAWFWINILIDLWFIADIVINLRTGFMAEGHFVNDDRLAAKHYVTKGSFVFDCIGSFPINLLLLPVQDDDSDASSAYGRTNKMLRLLRVAKMTKLLRLLKLGAYLEYVEVVIKFNPGLLRVIKLCLISLLCCHWFGCLWWLVSDIEMADQNLMSPWPTPQNEWHPPPWLKYSDDFSLKYWHSYFWGAGMALGMVPRDVEPITTLEAVISTLTMFGGLILAAVVISSFTSAFASMDNKRALAGQQLDVIRNYLLLKAVPNDLVRAHRLSAPHRPVLRAATPPSATFDPRSQPIACRFGARHSALASLSTTSTSSRPRSRWKTCSCCSTCRPTSRRSSRSRSTPSSSRAARSSTR